MTSAAAIVWAYTHNLTAVPPARMEFLQSAIAHIHAQGELELPPGARPPPGMESPDEPRYAAIRELTRIDTGTYQGVALPRRMLLWESDDQGRPSSAKASLPEAARWALEEGTPNDGDFVWRSGTHSAVLRLYYSATGAPGFVFQPLAPEKTQFGSWYRSPNWWIGIAAAVIFFIGGGNLLWTGRSIAQANGLMLGSGSQVQQAWAMRELNRREPPLMLCDATVAPRPPEEMTLCNLLTHIETIRSARLPAASANGSSAPAASAPAAYAPGASELTAFAGTTGMCRKRLSNVESTPAPDLDQACRAVWKDAVRFASHHRVIDTVSSGPVGRTLAAVAQIPFGIHARSAAGSSVSLAIPLFAMIVGVIGVILALGRGIGGRFLSALTNAQGRYSLSIAQAAGWTVLLLVPLLAIGMFNAGLIAEAMRDVFLLDPQKDVGDTFNLFPSMPAELWAVLGISLSSPLLTALILRTKKPVSELAAKHQPQESAGKITVRDSGTPPSIVDWFLGEEGDNAGRVDISRLQMVLITAGLMTVYAHLLFVSVQDLGLSSILTALDVPKSLISRFPEVNAMMAGLLALSHSTYLVVKAAPSPAKPSDK